MFRDLLSGQELRVPSRRELIAASNERLLHEKEIDVHDVRCECCGIPLTDIGKIRFTDRVVGPECAKHPELFPCRHLGAN